MMISRERVLATLRGDEPDRIPYFEIGIDRALAQELMGWEEPESRAIDLETNLYSVDEAKAISSLLKMDNIYYFMCAPIYARTQRGQDGRPFYGDGMIQAEADLSLLQFPDPYDEALYTEAEEFVNQKERYAACFVAPIGIFPTILSMGMENFCVALYNDRALVEALLDRYCDWMSVVAERVCQLGFDIFISIDDLAFKTGPFFSPTVFRDLVLPRFKSIAEKITTPWILHSDGNVMPLLDDLLSLGIAGLHPNEKGAMDIRAMKQQYGDRLCLLGNVDLNTLATGTPEEVDREVRELIRDMGPGGGYMVSSGNSLADYLRPENVLALSEAVQKYGRYPLHFR